VSVAELPHERTTSQPSIEGVFAPVPTPFQEDGSLDLKALGRFVRATIVRGVHGVALLGSTGEAPLLSDEESLKVLEAARRHVPADHTMIAGIGRQSTRATVTAARGAAGAGADVALVLPPFYYRGVTSEEALVEHFRAVAAASPLPLIVYNMPACTGVDLSAEALVRLAAVRGVVGVKDSGGNLAKLAAVRAATPPSLSVLAGSAGFFVPAISVGATGGILALANLAPEECVAMWRQARDGAWDEARALQARLVPVNDAVTRGFGVPGLKAALAMRGWAVGKPRPPLRPLGDDACDRLRAILSNAGFTTEEEAR